MSRQLIGLLEASLLPRRPDFIPRGRARGIKALGTRYEAQVARNLPSASRGLWWSYRDSNGPGWCQTDLLLDLGLEAVVLECKHSWTLEGMLQLQRLYLPVVGLALRRPVLGIQVCKHLSADSPRPAQSLSEALDLSRSGRSPLATLHWRGLGPIEFKPPELFAA